MLMIFWLSASQDSGIADKILGIRITWDKKHLKIDQQIYVEQILEEFKMTNCKAQAIPLSPSVDLNDLNSPKLNNVEHRMFRRIIGRLMYLAIGTRPDIMFTTNRLSQHLAEPKQIHLQASKHVLRYLRGTSSYSLAFIRGVATSPSPSLVGYADSAYANSSGKRSTSGHIFMLNESPVSWSSRKQSVVAQSTTESEYISLSEAVKQAIWIRHFLFSVNKQRVYHGNDESSTPILLFEDNQGAIRLTENPIDHPKTKHIAVRYHAIRDGVSRGEICVRYKQTSEMIADGLTKAANRTVLEKFLSMTNIG